MSTEVFLGDCSLAHLMLSPRYGRRELTGFEPGIFRLPCECSSIPAGPLHQCLFNCQTWRETSSCLIASFDKMMPCHTPAKDVWICFIKEDIICKYRQASLCMSCDRLQQGTATSLFNSLTVQQLNKGASCLFFPPWGTFGEYIYHCDILTP